MTDTSNNHELKAKEAVDIKLSFHDFTDTLEKEVSLRLVGLLESANTDLDWAVADMKGRAKIFAEHIPIDDELGDLIETLTDMGAGGIRTSESTSEIADSVSRQADAIHGYILSRGMITEEIRALLEEHDERLIRRFAATDINA